MKTGVVCGRITVLKSRGSFSQWLKSKFLEGKGSRTHMLEKSPISGHQVKSVSDKKQGFKLLLKDKG